MTDSIIRSGLWSFYKANTLLVYATGVPEELIQITYNAARKQVVCGIATGAETDYPVSFAGIRNAAKTAKEQIPDELLLQFMTAVQHCK